MRKLQSKQIGNDSFGVMPLPAMRSWALQPRIWPAVAEVGESVVDILGGKQGTVKGLLEKDLSELRGALGKAFNAVGGFFSKMPPRELEAVTRELLAEATINGKRLFMDGAGAGDLFDSVFVGRMADLWHLVGWAVWINYRDFFDKAKALIPSAPAEEKAQGEHPSAA